MPVIKSRALIEAHCQRIYGCDEAAALRANDGRPLRAPRSPAARYCSQRHSAKERGIDWCLSFPEWMAIWATSGRYAQRGVGHGRYCMARLGDEGPYSAGNVVIQLATQNSRDGLLTRHRRAGRDLDHGRDRRFFSPAEPLNAAQQDCGAL